MVLAFGWLVILERVAKRLDRKRLEISTRKKRDAAKD